MCARRHCRNECADGVIAGVVLGFQTAKGASDMPTGCDVGAVDHSASESSSFTTVDDDILLQKINDGYF